MSHEIYQVDAFADAIFTGNPAAVMPLERWLSDPLLQAIAAENNLSETAFFVPSPAGDADFDLRWFTPLAEVDLCGHATLASAHVLFEERGFADNLVRFASPSGILTVTRRGSDLAMDFPSRPPAAHDFVEAAASALGARPAAFARSTRDLVAIFDHADEVKALEPDFRALARLDHFAVIATTPGDGGDLDFVCRFFAPRAGVDEDPVTGSAFSTLIPYWAERLGKTELRARQVSRRGGHVTGRLLSGDRVEIAGQARTYLKGRVVLPDQSVTGQASRR